MKKLILLSLLLPSVAFAQGLSHTNVALYNSGGNARVVPSAVVTVCAAADPQIPCTTKVSIFTNYQLTSALTNPFNADANGNYSFYAGAGNYTVTVTGIGITGLSYQITLGVGTPSSLAGPGTITGTFAGNYTTTGNDAHSGTETFTGAVTTSKLNQVFYVDGVTYITPQAAATAACALTPAGGTIYVPPGTYAAPTTICSNLHFKTWNGYIPAATSNALGTNQVGTYPTDQQTTLTSTTGVTYTGLGNIAFDGFVFDCLGNNVTCVTLNNVSFSYFDWTIQNAGTGTALLLTVGTVQPAQTISNVFNRLWIFNAGTGMTLTGGPWPAANPIGVTLNHFRGVIMNNITTLGMNFTRTDDSNFFDTVWIGSLSNTAKCVSFNTNTPTIEQDADNNIFDKLVCSPLNPGSYTGTYLTINASRGNVITAFNPGGLGGGSVLVTTNNPTYTLNYAADFSGQAKDNTSLSRNFTASDCASGTCGSGGANTNPSYNYQNNGVNEWLHYSGSDNNWYLNDFTNNILQVQRGAPANTLQLTSGGQVQWLNGSNRTLSTATGGVNFYNETQTAVSSVWNGSAAVADTWTWQPAGSASGVPGFGSMTLKYSGIVGASNLGFEFPNRLIFDGATSGTAIIASPAVAGTIGNPFTFTNAISPSSASSVDIGTTALPWANLWLGTAATNNFKFQPAATAASRVISIPDPLAAENLALIDTMTVNFIPKAASSTTSRLSPSLESDDGTTMTYTGTGGYSAPKLTSTVSTGTAPLTVTSTTAVANLKVQNLSAVSGGDLPSTAGGTDVGSTALPYGNLWLGTAATNNFKFQPAATSGARIITVADPLSPTTVALPLTIGNGTSTMASGSVAAATCATAVTTAATGVLTTDSIEWAYATAPTLTTDALLHISPYVTAGNVNFTRCNPTAGAIVGTAIVINWRVVR